VAQAKAAGVATINYGLFFNNIIDFIIVAFAVFMLVKQINRFRREKPVETPSTKECPYCLSAVPLKAIRCAHCTSDLKAS